MVQMGDHMMEFERTRVNLWHIGAIVLSVIANAFALGVVYAKFDSRITDIEEYRATSAAETTANFATLNQQLKPFDTLTFRLAQVEAVVKANNEAQNARMDRIVESLGNKLDALAENLNAVRTDLKVLTQKVEQGAKPTRIQFLQREAAK